MKMNNADDSHVDGATSGCRCTAGWSTGPAWLHLLHPWPPVGPLPGHEGSSRLRWPTPPGLWTCWPHCHGRSYESESEKKSQFSRAFCVRRRVFYVFGTQWHLIYHHDVETIIGSNKNKQMQRFFCIYLFPHLARASSCSLDGAVHVQKGACELISICCQHCNKPPIHGVQKRYRICNKNCKLTLVRAMNDSVATAVNMMVGTSMIRAINML